MKLPAHARTVAFACLAVFAGCEGWLANGPPPADAGADGGSPTGAGGGAIGAGGGSLTGAGGGTTGAGGGTAGAGGGATGGGAAGGHSGGGGGDTECSDGVDNDSDGLVDWQYDLGCANGADADEAAGPREQEGGFTTYDVGADSLVIHVSSTAGNDANDGRSPALAVKTLARAAALVRDGKHDFLLLRRGDVWRGQSLGRFKSGQDAAHPLVVATYGESAARPRLEVSGQFIDHDGQARSHVAVMGLEIVPLAMIPGDPGYDGATGGGFRYVGGGEGLLIEDCHLLYGGWGVGFTQVGASARWVI